jgi:hypothetical protein
MANQLSANATAALLGNVVLKNGITPLPGGMHLSSGASAGST